MLYKILTKHKDSTVKTDIYTTFIAEANNEAQVMRNFKASWAGHKILKVYPVDPIVVVGIV